MYFEVQILVICNNMNLMRERIVVLSFLRLKIEIVNISM
jgi:hypothetical protein